MQQEENSKAFTTPPDPLKKKAGILQSNDEHIAQDFPGFPHLPAKENIINPKTNEERIAAGIENEEAFPHNNPANKKNSIEENNSDGSGSAFSATEEIAEDGFDRPDEK